MAKIFITGRLPVEATQDEVIRIREMWEASKIKGHEYMLPKVLEAGGAVFEGKDIRGFEIIDFASKQADAMEYNVYVEGTEKDKVRFFEKEFEAWKAENPQFTEWQKYHFLEAKGLLKMGANRPLDIVTTKDNKVKHGQYLEYLKLFSSLGTLKYLREKAASHNDPDYEAKRVRMFQSLKADLYGKNKSLAESSKDFDKMMGNEDLDVSKIPF